jgi:hypothetical protein
MRRSTFRMIGAVNVLVPVATAVAHQLLLARPALAQNGTEPATEESTDVGMEVLRYAVIVVLLLLSAMFSGLTLGIVGLDTN